MDREQTAIIDVTNWTHDPEYFQYPEGSRDKTLLYSPDLIQTDYAFLKPHYRYLFKLSSHRSPEEFWMEILAYHISIYMGIPVPPAFAAYDSKTGKVGALIEWFLKPYFIPPDNYDWNTNTSDSGGDWFKKLIPDFDSKTGKQHNFETIETIFTILSPITEGIENWKEHWAKILLFDALIGNTDRHQDNWAIIWDSNYIKKALSDISQKKFIPRAEFSPAFDNGSSMGREIPAQKFLDWLQKEKKLENYILRGKHHMKWSIHETKKCQHWELIRKIAEKYPETQKTMLNCLKKLNENIFLKILNDLTSLDNISVPLSSDRAKFMLKLLTMRHQRLIYELT